MSAVRQLGGVMPVFQTPFDEQMQVDAEDLGREIDWIFGQGADGIVMGMVSEVSRLADDERFTLAEQACRLAAGRGPVVVSVGAESTDVAVARARQAETAGASAVMAIPPVSVRAGDAELAKYYDTIFDAIDLPVIVQDASGYIGGALSIALQAGLVERHGERVYLKPEAPPVGVVLGRLAEATGGRARVLEGLGGTAIIESHRRGAIGTLPGADVCWAVIAAWNALERGDYERAYEIVAPLSALVAMETSLDSFVAIEKHLLVHQGVIGSSRCRGPVSFLADEVTLSEVERLYRRLRVAVDQDPTPAARVASGP